VSSKCREYIISYRCILLVIVYTERSGQVRPNGLPLSCAATIDRERVRAISIRQIAIGRASRPFPRSKRSRRVSPHSAFQLGRGTLTEQTRRCRPRGAPVRRPSSAFPAASVGDHFIRLTLATFTVSAPLQCGIWLLCRLCPPFHTLAFSRPLRVKWCWSSLIPR